MNCLYEAAATVFMQVRGRFIPAVDDGLCEAEEELQACRAKLRPREREYAAACDTLWNEALEKRRRGDTDGATEALLKRKLPKKQRDKLRGALALIEKQIDTMRSSELDKDIINSLKLSNSALKKAGVGVEVEEAQSLMNHLEDHVQSVSGLTELMAEPLATVPEDEVDLDLEAELGLLEDACGVAARVEPRVQLPPVPVPISSMIPARPAPAARFTQVDESRPRSPGGSGTPELAQW